MSGGKKKRSGAGDDVAKATRQPGDGEAPGDEVAKKLAILNKPIRELIEEAVGKVCMESDYCYCEGNCYGGHEYISGHSEAVDLLEKLFEQYLQAQLQSRGITN